MIRTIARRAALRVSPIRRLFDFAMVQSQRATVLLAELTTVSEEREALSQRVNALLAELATVSEERAALELQLYVLRSDHHRTLTRVEACHQEVEQLRTALMGAEKAAQTAHQEISDLRAVELEFHALRSDHQRALVQADELSKEASKLQVALTSAQEATHAARQETHDTFKRVDEAVSGLKAERADINLMQAKLIGHMTREFGNVEGLLRVIQGAKVTTGTADAQINLYLNLLENALTGQLIKDAPISPWSNEFDPEIRMLGRDWPSQAQTMIGGTRMRNIRVLAERVLQDGVAGDFIETGVWRGGACIFMRGILAAYGVRDRTVWVADSFEGLPPPDPDTYPADAGDRHHTFPELAVSLEEVRSHFKAYDLLDDQVKFLKGWFVDTLPLAPIQKIAILRLDGDMYSSTIQALDSLYHKLNDGGYIILDDYNLAGCRKATDYFREKNKIKDAIIDIDGAGAFWRKNG